MDVLASNFQIQAKNEAGEYKNHFITSGYLLDAFSNISSSKSNCYEFEERQKACVWAVAGEIHLQQ